jgi:hypothetical protein
MNMQNPYMQMTNLGGSENPMMQNTAAQQAMIQQNMSNMGSLANQALDTKGTQMAQFDPKAMAEALRAGQQPNKPAPVIDNSTMSPNAYQDYMDVLNGQNQDYFAGWSR